MTVGRWPLTRLRPAIDVLPVDTFRFFRFIQELLKPHTPPSLRTSGIATAPP